MDNNRHTLLHILEVVQVVVIWLRKFKVTMVHKRISPSPSRNYKNQSPEVLYKKVLLKFRRSHRKTPASESLL